MDELELTAWLGVIFDSLRIPWVVGGSVASSMIGEPRSTDDVDVAVRMVEAQVEPLVEALGSDFYADREMIAEAVRDRSSFNLIHLPTSTKVDLFVLGDGELDVRQIERRRQVTVDAGLLWVGSAETQLIRKLSWYRSGGEVSERQWRDVLGILSVQGERIDMGELRSLADEARVDDLLDRALEDYRSSET